MKILHHPRTVCTAICLAVLSVFAPSAEAAPPDLTAAGAIGLAVLVTSLTAQGAEPKTEPDTPAAEKNKPAGRLSVQTLGIAHRRGVHRAACRVHRSRHLVSGKKIPDIDVFKRQRMAGKPAKLSKQTKMKIQ